MRRPGALLLLVTIAACSGAAGPTAGTATTTLATTTVLVTTTVTATVPTSTSTSAPPSTTTTSPPTTTTVPFDPSGATIPELQAAMASGRLTAVDLTRFSLDRVLAFDPTLSAMLALDPGALDQAAARDAERAAGLVRGPLHGIPIVLKDNIGTADLPTTAGSLSLQGFVPAADAEVVARLRAAGAVILGKTNLHEFARDVTTVSSLGGQTRNPYDTSRYPGGSSGGTGAAVAAGYAPAGLGTDTCGSVRIPAAYNNLYGLRPTIGLIPTDGVIPLSPTEDTVGPMARTVVDLALTLDVISGSGTRHSDAAAAGTLAGMRIGVVTVLMDEADPGVRASIEAALDLMAAHGAEVVAAPIPGFHDLRGGAAGVFLREWRDALDAYLADQPAAPFRSMAEIVASGRYHPALAEQLQRALAATTDSSEYRAALDRRPIVSGAIEGWLADHDLDALAYPTMAQPPARIGDQQRGNNCGTASVGGLPAIVVPAGFTASGLPTGLELLGARHSEALLITIAAGYEAVAPEWVGPETADS